MGTRFGEANATPVPRVRKASALEKEFIRAGNGPDDEADATPAPVEGKKRAKRRSINKLSDGQIDDATDRIIMGESLAKLADELNVNVDMFAKKIKTRLGMRYMREWQQSVRFDCLRAELILQRSLRGFCEEGDVPSGRLALDVLNYRAKVLSFGAVNPEEQSQRVAGLSQEELFDAIMERL